MALWTPYKEKVALDLSKNAETFENTPRTSSIRYCSELTTAASETALPPMWTYRPYAGIPESASSLSITRAYGTPFGSAQVASMPTYGSNAAYTSQRPAVETYPAYAASVAAIPAAPPLQAFAAPHPHYGYQYEFQPPIPQVVPTVTPDSIESWPHVKPNEFSPAECDGQCFDGESLSNEEEYQEFEQVALQAMAETNGRSLVGNNPRMRRVVQTSRAPDDSYRRQRVKNNLAAKKSRDKRKMREVRLALQVSYLKKKVAELKTRLVAGYCDQCKPANS